MIRFFYTVFLIGILPILLFSSCLQESAEAKQKALAAAQELDKQEMLMRFKERVQALDTLPIEENSEAMALTLVLDESVADEVEAVLAQLAPDQPLDNKENKNKKPSAKIESDSASMDSLLDISKASIHNGALLMGVRDYKETAGKIKALVEKFNAKIEAEEERTTEFRLENTLIVHLSPAQFADFVGQVRAMAVDIPEKRIWEQDLSAQFVDLKARLKAKYEAKLRLEQFMRAARNSNEVLPIQRELDIITEEIESVTRTARALSKKAISSTITVTFYQEVMKAKAEEANFGNRFVAGAKDGWVNFKEFLIQVALNWPYVTIGMIFLLIAWLAVRSSRRRSRQFKMQAMQAQQQWILQQQSMQQSVTKKNSGVS